MRLNSDLKPRLHVPTLHNFSDKHSLLKTMVKMFSSIGLLLFMVCLNAGQHAVVTGTVNNCPDLSCGNQVIRFPFRIKGRHPSPCGFPGFDLSCSSSNETLIIELPESVKLTVKNIDYTQQTIELSDPDGCLYRQLHNLTLSASRFQFKPKPDYDDFGAYQLFNCSLMNRDSSLDYYLVPCLSTSSSQAYAIPSSRSIGYLPLLFCTKMFNVSFNNPFDFLPEDNFLRLTWSDPKCNHCESKGNRCGWKWKNNTANNEIYCFPKTPKGKLSVARFYSMFNSSRCMHFFFCIS